MYELGGHLYLISEIIGWTGVTDIGFTSDDSYDVMIKTLAAPVTEAMHGYAAVER